MANCAKEKVWFGYACMGRQGHDMEVKTETHAQTHANTQRNTRTHSRTHARTHTHERVRARMHRGILPVSENDADAHHEQKCARTYE